MNVGYWYKVVQMQQYNSPSAEGEKNYQILLYITFQLKNLK